MNYYTGMPAHYSDKHSAEFRGNPWLEALPVYEDDPQIRARLEDSSAFFNPAWRTVSTRERQTRLICLNANLFVPRQCHIDSARDILAHLFARYLEEPVHSYPYFSKDPIIPGKPRRAYAKNVALIGPAGSGKTLAIQRILELIPQTIIHSKHNGRDFRMIQVTHLLVHCPPKGGGKALVKTILLELERVLDTKLPDSRTQAAAEDILRRQTTLAGIGCIVINEFQNILTGTCYSKDIMSALTSINEKCGIPLILAGTEEVFDVVKTIAHGARRVAGSPPWKDIKKGDPWEKWIRAVFQFYLTKDAPLFDDTVSEYFFQFSQGNPDAVVSLFTTAQGLALAKGREQIQWADYRRARKYLYLRDPELRNKTRGSDKPSNRFGQNNPEPEDPTADPSKVDEDPPPMR